VIDLDDDAVTSAEGLDAAPPRHKRQIVDVDLERVDDTRLEGTVHHKACEHCGDAVDLLETHGYACLWSGTPPRRQMHKPVFCDRWCWIEWLRREATSTGPSKRSQ